MNKYRKKFNNASIEVVISEKEIMLSMIDVSLSVQEGMDDDPTE